MRASSLALVALAFAIVACGRVVDGVAPAEEAGAALDAGALDGESGTTRDAGDGPDAASEPRPDGGAMCVLDGGATFVCGKLCTPKTCADFPADCAERRYYDGCCATITCPGAVACGPDLACCGLGRCLSACPGLCMPKSCSDSNGVPAFELCGTTGDGCGGLLECGPCSGGRACSSALCATACP